MNDRQNGQQTADPQALCITLILDESASMQSCVSVARAGNCARHRCTIELAAEPRTDRKTCRLPRPALVCREDV